MEHRDNLKECIAHAALRVGVPLYQLIRRGLNDFLTEYPFDDKTPQEIAVGALEELCSRDANERIYDFAICAGVVGFLDEACDPAGSDDESNQRIKDLATIMVSPGTPAAYAAWTRAYYR